MIGIASLALIALIFGLGRLAVVQAERRDTERVAKEAEKARGDQLQRDLDDLRARTAENQRFFDIIRQLQVTNDAVARQALVDQLKNLQFGSVTTTTVPDSREFPRPSSATTTPSTTSAPRATSTTTTTRPPPSTTTTRPPPVTTPSSLVCVEVPITKTTICT